MATDISKLGVKATWEELTEGMIVAGAGTSKEFNTGEWSEVKPEFIADKCKQCLLCKHLPHHSWLRLHFQMHYECSYLPMLCMGM